MSIIITEYGEVEVSSLRIRFYFVSNIINNKNYSYFA